MRVDYLKDLGVQVIRLNSIFPAPHYPEHYRNVTNLLAIQRDLGTFDDFNSLILAVHRKNMSLVLDLPLHPYLKNLNGGNSHLRKPNKRDKAVRERRDAIASVLSTTPPVPEPTSFESIMNVLSSVPASLDPNPNAFETTAPPEHEEDNTVTAAIKFWLEKGVDGFYLKGLEHYVADKNFVDLVRHWKSLVGPNRILICAMDVLDNASQDSIRNVILDRFDLVDVTLNLANGTTEIKNQVNAVLEGVLFRKAGYPWVHWSVGSVDTKRIASILNVNNASIAASLLSMMLPGTTNIFYGDEVRLSCHRLWDK